ncbi:hypothetical protein IKE97_00170 [Candidatus Saccharibacteria bacterium]|nr:hypothetical protein [Candidatus Saccharibacteria bacterium]
MRHKVLLSSATSAALLGATMFPASVFADDNYGIVYSGGTPLSETNLTVNSSLIEELSPLISHADANDFKVTVSSNWQKGWHNRLGNDSECHEIYYFIANDGSSTGTHQFSISNKNYQIDVNIDNVNVLNAGNDSDGNPKKIAVGIEEENGFLYGSNLMYGTKAGCEAKTVEDRKSNAIQRTDANNREFIETTIKLKKVGSNSTYVTNDDDLFFGITDIDASQSYKILNAENTLSKNNMFVKDARYLQPEVYIDKTTNSFVPNPSSLPANCYSGAITESAPEAPFLNCFNDGYIYSQYSTKTASSDVNASADSDVFVSLKKKTQEDGLNIVFGFTGSAGSGIEYYAKQFKVTYASDKNGEMAKDARTTEDLIAGDTASGSETEPKEGYIFKYWTANVKVTLTNGKEIKAGQPITSEELKQVVVDKDIEFTAVHALEDKEDKEEEEESEVATPDTGASTKDINAVLIPASLITILLAALTIRALPRLTHKKVGFDK